MPAHGSGGKIRRGGFLPSVEGVFCGCDTPSFLDLRIRDFPKIQPPSHPSPGPSETQIFRKNSDFPASQPDLPRTLKNLSETQIFRKNSDFTAILAPQVEPPSNPYFCHKTRFSEKTAIFQPPSQIPASPPQGSPRIPIGLHRPFFCWLVLAVGSLRPSTAFHFQDAPSSCCVQCTIDTSR